MSDTRGSVAASTRKVREARDKRLQDSNLDEVAHRTAAIARVTQSVAAGIAAIHIHVDIGAVGWRIVERVKCGVGSGIVLRVVARILRSRVAMLEPHSPATGQAHSKDECPRGDGGEREIHATSNDSRISWRCQRKHRCAKLAPGMGSAMVRAESRGALWMDAAATLFVLAGVYASVARADDGARPPADDSQTIYTFTNREGRQVFVNGEALIPPEYRAVARPFDVSHVDLNTKLGNDIDLALDQQLAEIATSEPCQQARKTVASGLVGYAWERYGPLIAVGATLLFLLVLTPFMFRWLSPPVWTRALLLIVPLLSVVGLLAFVVHSSRGALSRVRDAAIVCSGAGTPPSIAGRFDRLFEAQRALDRTLAETISRRERSIEDALKE